MYILFCYLAADDEDVTIYKYISISVCHYGLSVDDVTFTQVFTDITYIIPDCLSLSSLPCIISNPNPNP